LKIPDLLVGADEPSTASSWHDYDHVPYALNLTIAGILFLVALVVALSPPLLDLPLTIRFNSLAGRYPALDLLLYDLDTSFTCSGVIVMALVWGCWFSRDDRLMRTRILAGTAASFAASIVSRRLQHDLPTHLRPYYNPAVHFQHPLFMSSWKLNTWYSFPSDHVALFAGLMTVAWFAKSKLRVPAVIWLIFVESSRIFEGAHFPSDLAGGAALAAAFVWTSQCPVCLRLSRRVMQFEVTAPSMFYIAAFFLSFQLATLFMDFRIAGSGILKLYHRDTAISEPSTDAASE
jgi:undecaprenyl-diphosphatase